MKVKIVKKEEIVAEEPVEEESFDESLFDGLHSTTQE